jgi:hypothetical protein
MTRGAATGVHILTPAGGGGSRHEAGKADDDRPAMGFAFAIFGILGRVSGYIFLFIVVFWQRGGDWCWTGVCTCLHKVLCTTDTTEGYVEAEKATRVLGLGYWTCGCTKELVFGFGIIIFPLPRWLLFYYDYRFTSSGSG